MGEIADGSIPAFLSFKNGRKPKRDKKSEVWEPKVKSWYLSSFPEYAKLHWTEAIYVPSPKIHHPKHLKNAPVACVYCGRVYKITATDSVKKHVQLPKCRGKEVDSSSSTSSSPSTGDEEESSSYSFGSVDSSFDLEEFEEGLEALVDYGKQKVAQIKDSVELANDTTKAVTQVAKDAVDVAQASSNGAGDASGGCCDCCGSGGSCCECDGCCSCGGCGGCGGCGSCGSCSCSCGSCDD